MIQVANSEMDGRGNISDQDSYIARNRSGQEFQNLGRPSASRLRNRIELFEYELSLIVPVEISLQQTTGLKANTRQSERQAIVPVRTLAALSQGVVQVAVPPSDDC